MTLSFTAKDEFSRFPIIQAMQRQLATRIPELATHFTKKLIPRSLIAINSKEAMEINGLAALHNAATLVAPNNLLTQ